MPHKHTRREKDKDPSTFDLPPSQIAKPLPVTSLSKRKQPQRAADPPSAKGGQKRKREDAKKDDAPRAFKRLMAFAQGKKVRPGLDDGADRKAGKQKGKNVASTATEKEEPPEVPKIRHGERMSEFAARVDAALPLGGLINKTAKNGKDPLGLKVRRTRKERKMHKLYDEWREEDRKLKEEREEEQELAEEQEMENDTLGVKWRIDLEDTALGGKRTKKGKRGRVLGEAAGKEGDIWDEVKRRRGEGKIGLHDVVKAPPVLNKAIRKPIVVQGAGVEVGNVPKAAGSLRRREELQTVREQVVASYRKMVDERRANVRG